MSNSVAETLVGAVVLALAGGFLVYGANTAELSLRGGYDVVAKFRKAEGLNVGSDVRIAGVKVGTVSDMVLDLQSYMATVSLNIDSQVKLPDDSSAKITAASLLGDNFVAIEPGASEYMLEPGDEIQFTQSSFSIGDVIGRFIHGAAGGDN